MQQISTEGVWDETRLGRKGDTLGNVQVFEFDHTHKWYMDNQAPVIENDTQKHLWDFDIQTDHLISARRPDLIIINKKRAFAKLSTLLSQLTTE